MKRPTKWERLRGVGRELGMIARRGRQVWRLIPGRHKWALIATLAVMSLASAASTVVPLCLRQLIDCGRTARSTPRRPRPTSPGSPPFTWRSSGRPTWSASP